MVFAVTQPRIPFRSSTFQMCRVNGSRRFEVWTRRRGNIPGYAEGSASIRAREVPTKVELGVRFWAPIWREKRGVGKTGFQDIAITDTERNSNTKYVFG